MSGNVIYHIDKKDDPEGRLILKPKDDNTYTLYDIKNKKSCGHSFQLLHFWNYFKQTFVGQELCPECAGKKSFSKHSAKVLPMNSKMGWLLFDSCDDKEKNKHRMNPELKFKASILDEKNSIEITNEKGEEWPLSYVVPLGSMLGADVFEAFTTGVREQLNLWGYGICVTNEFYNTHNDVKGSTEIKPANDAEGYETYDVKQFGVYFYLNTLAIRPMKKNEEPESYKHMAYELSKWMIYYFASNKCNTQFQWHSLHCLESMKASVNLGVKNAMEFYGIEPTRGPKFSDIIVMYENSIHATFKRE